MKSAILCLLLGLAPGSLWADAQWKALAARYPQAMGVFEDVRTDFAVAQDGKYVHTYAYRATILQEPGLASLSSFSDTYYDRYDQMSVKRAVVTGPDGQVTPVGPDHIKDLPVPAYGPFFLQNVRMVVVTFPQLQVGATVELELETRRNAPPMDHAFSAKDFFQTGYPILQRQLTVTLPEAMPLAWKVHRGEAAFTRTVKEGRAVCRWEVGEQPALTAEPGMPPFEEVIPVLAVSTIPSWKEVSRWYAGLAKDALRMTPTLHRLVEETTAGLDNREDRIRALFFWVSRHIRYVETGFTGEKAGFAPAAAELTYERKYGVCRDKACLLTALLRSIGVEAHLALITAGVRQDVAIPGIQFNHAVVAVRQGDGRFSFLDPTAEDSRAFLPSFDQDKFALVCTESGEDIQLTPLAPASENCMDIALETALSADGSLTAKVVMAPAGIHDLGFRGFLKGLPPARRETFFSTLAGNLFPGSALTDLALSELDDLQVPLRVAFTLAVPRQGVRAGAFLVFTTPGQGGLLDLLLPSMLSGATGPQRTYPLALGSTLASRIRETVLLPPGYAARSLPVPVAMEEPGASLTRTCSMGPEGLVYTEDFMATQLTYAGEAYQGLRRLTRMRGQLRDGKVVLVRQGGSR